MTPSDYYVYVYIDPRNLEEFYFGKGKGSRRFAHLSDKTDSEKVARIDAIKAEGLLPTIRTVATGLTESEAHLVETTLIWKLGRGLTNIAAGKFASRFRLHNTLHKEIPGFDFQNGIYYFNVGEGTHRNWDDCKRLGFISAGQGPQWRDQIREFAVGDVIVAYLKGKGFVGVGRVLASAVPYLDYRHEGLLLQDFDLVAPMMFENAGNPDLSEYIARVEWKAAFPREKAKWEQKSGLYTTPLIRASLERQTITVDFIEKEFDIKLGDLAR